MQLIIDNYNLTNSQIIESVENPNNDITIQTTQVSQIITNNVADISIESGAGGGTTFTKSASGIHTTDSIGINTNALPTTLVGAGNSFQGMYVSNGMTIYDNELNGSHYISTNFNGLMAGPVTVNGVLTVDGNYVVV